MRLRPEARVGLIVLIAAVALGGIIVFFNGYGLRSSTYTVCAVFGDVLRLADGAEVRLAGVRIGQVSGITLTEGKQAKVEMLVARKYAGAIPEDSIAQITTGGVMGVGDYYVEIIPGKSKAPLKQGECLRSGSIPKIDDLMVQVRDIITGLNGSVDSVNKILGNPRSRRALEESLDNVRVATAGAIDLVNNANAMVCNTNSFVEESKPEFQQVLARMNDASADFAAITRDTRRALEGGSVEDIQKTLASASKTAENLEATSAQLRALAEDKQVNCDLRQTIKSASEAAQGAAEIVSRVQKVIGPKTRTPKPAPVGFVPDVGSRVDAFVLTENGPFRLDYNYTLRGRSDDFYRIGLFNIGETNNLNLQAGKSINEQSAFRYGLYAGRIGVGYDRYLGSGFNLQADLYRPNDINLETKVRYDLNRNFGAWLGANQIFEGGGLMVGLQYRK